MNPQSIARYSSSLLIHVIDPAARSLAIGILASLMLRLFRVKNPSARLAVWTSVLYVALAMPLLAWVMPPLSFALPAAPLFAKITSVAAAPLAGPPASSANVNTMRTAAILSTAPVFDASAGNVNETARHASPGVSPSPRLSTRRSQSNETALVAQSRSARPLSGASVNPGPMKPSVRSAFPWGALAAAIFSAVTLLMLARIILGSILGQRLARSAQTIADCDAIRILIRQARMSGSASAPRLAESDVVSVPLTLGVFKPVILLPSCWRKWDEPTLSAVIAHEMSHIARRDALTRRLSLIHRAVFWFSPLSWWLNRAIVDAAEEASDEAALLCGANRAFYAETLLGFFAALSENSGRVYWQGVSMASPGQADRRVDRILSWKGAVSMRIRKSFVVGLAVFGVPLVLLAAAARPSARQSAVPAPAVSPAPGLPSNVSAAPEPAPVIAAAPAPIPAIAQAVPSAPLPPPSAAPQTPESPAPPPAQAASPAAPVPPDDAVAPGDLYKQQMRAFQEQIEQQVKEQMKQLKNDPQLKQEMNVEVLKNLTMQLDAIPKVAIQPFDFNFQVGPTAKINIGDGGDRFVIVSDDSPIVMSGDSQDVEHATALRSKINGDFIWFQHDEKSYIIRDQATVNQAKALFKTQQDLGDKQQALGKQMRDLGDQMRALGQKMRDVHVTVPDVSAQMEKLEAQMKQLSSSGGTQQQVGDLERQLGDLMRQIGQTQSQAGDQQRQIGEQMRALGDQQRALGEQMRQIGDQERQASQQAHTQMDQLLNDAITKGTAQPE